MTSHQEGSCLWCGSTDVQWTDRLSTSSRRQWSCRECGRTWSHLSLKIRRGETLETEHGTTTATTADVAWLRQIRAFLLEVFAQQRHVEVAELREHVGLPHELDEIDRLLTLITTDCTRRGEPSLSALVSALPEAPSESDDPPTEPI